MDDVEASMATVPSRTGDDRPVRPPVAMPASGFGGSGPHCGHTPSCHRYVGVVLVGAASAGFVESACFTAGSWKSVLLAPSSWSRPSCNHLGGGHRGRVAFGEPAPAVVRQGKSAQCFERLEAQSA